MSDSTIGTAASGLFGTLIALAFVLVLAWGALKLLRRWQDRAGGGGSTGVTGPGLRVVRALPVGPRERVVVIEVDGERMLIGVSAASVTLLTRLAPSAPAAERYG